LTDDQEKQWASFRLGSGLSVVSPGEGTVAVVAGMGGLLISQILEESEKIARNLDKLILQPRNGQGKLRYWLL
jgi:tRNA (adenine22-N1)-methyltransferase